ncbi:hypothetical protein FQN49_008473, partial [Arthroderma sp. PD_2]
GKGRHDHPSWFRDGDTQENADHEEEKTPVRNREWRRGVQGQDRDRDRDWNRPAKHEQDPEWLDSSNKSEQKEAHTQEDFQRWKERMKTGGAQQSDETKKKASPEIANVEVKPAETRRTEGEMFSSLEPSYKTDAGFDDFFGPWGGPKSTQDAGAYGSAIAGPGVKEAQAAKPAKSSRFAGFFNAPTEPAKEAEATAPQPGRPVSTDADQEGFQRILQLLGGNKSRNSTPQAEEMMRPRATPPQQSQQDVGHIPAPTASPHRDAVNQRQPYMGFPEPPREQAPPGLEQLLAQKAPKESRPSPQDTDLLLRLMQQAKIGPSHQGQIPSHVPLQNPGIQNMPEMQSRNQELPKQKSPLFFDDPAIANMQRPDANDPRSQLRRRPTGGPTGYFEDMQFQGPSSGNHTPANPPGLRTQQSAVQPAMGLQRPPGLEQVSSPGGWPNPQQMQQGASAQFIGRPSMPNPPPNRNMNPNFPPVPQMPMPGGMPPPNDRQAFQRGPGAGVPANFGPPPGIVPPPGYVSMNHPPPSAFPPMPHTPEAMMGLSHGHPAHFGAGPQQGVAGGHQPSSRQLLDMFTGHGGGSGDGNMGNRNGSGMMGPPYR